MRLDHQPRLELNPGAHLRCGRTAGMRQADSRRAERGSAVLVVFILLTVMSAIVASNGLALHHLNREIQLTETRQKRRLEAQTALTPPPAAEAASSRTNAMPQPKPSLP